MTVNERIEKIKSIGKGPLYYFAAACHNMLVQIEREGKFSYSTEYEAKVHQQGIKDFFKVKTTLKDTTLTL